MTVSDRRVRRATTALAGLTAAALALTACGSGEGGPGGSDGKLKVVASTSVWASVAQAVGGDKVEVEALISDPAADPHSYESTPRDAAKVTDADLVVLNGGGYDEFAEQILAGKPKPTVEAVAGEHPEPAPAEEHGHEHPEPAPAEEHGHDHSVNEHVWYDLHAVHETADRIADELGKLQPANAQAFKDSAARFSGEVGGLETRVQQLAAKQQGKKVIVTEPVAHYLVEAAKLEDITPPEFVKAIESESDPSAAAVAEIQNAVGTRQAAAVLYNPQTESPVTESVRRAAEQNQTPVVEMTELLPAGKTYVQWMDAQITALDAALNRN